MDYMRQLNGFWNWRRLNEVSHAQADLYFSILAAANMLHWKEPFTIPNTTLMSMCQTSKSELHKLRLALIQKCLIGYCKGKKGSAGIYTISPLYEINLDTNLETNMDTNLDINLETNMEDIIKHKKKNKKYTSTRTRVREASYDLAEIEKMLNDFGT